MIFDLFAFLLLSSSLGLVAVVIGVLGNLHLNVSTPGQPWSDDLLGKIEPYIYEQTGLVYMSLPWQCVTAVAVPTTKSRRKAIQGRIMLVFCFYSQRVK